MTSYRICGRSFFEASPRDKGDLNTTTVSPSHPLKNNNPVASPTEKSIPVATHSTSASSQNYCHGTQKGL